MSFWKNKHVLISTLMAPILGLLAYFAVDHFVGEKPKAAEAGQSYPLVEKPNCRYESGLCGLKNADFELTLSYERPTAGRLHLMLESVHPLDGVMLAMAAGEPESNQPKPMRASTNDGLRWALEIANPDPYSHRLYLVAAAGESLYYGDVSTRFTLKSETPE